ncbi:nucleotidyltransferase family protein [Agaribacter marinus]|uniref:Nucleotidyltransferase family protein n=1 Tax=Agaribacter marinus TaxID=1431249 RepID=A0AA37SYY8_9ALTE|nr:nucleotidyltransferase family protein [Agaribacter marinus]GLR70914.1 hypothetical protein GCM10007852_18220 [Agaribacter marinus]
MIELDVEQVIDCYLHPEKITALEPNQLSTLIIVLRQQKMLARVAANLISLNLLPDLHVKAQRHFKNAYLMASKQKLQVWEEAKLLVSQLSSASAYLIFLKGAAYSLADSLASNKVAEGRYYSDIDILVDKRSINECEQVLAIKGWIAQEINNYDDKYYRQWAHEIPPMCHGTRGTIIDIHHNIVPLISGAAPNIQLLINHRVLLGDDIWVLSQPAQFVHSAIHLFRNEEFSSGFRDLTDLHIFMKQNLLENTCEKFVREVIAIASEINFAKEVYLALYFLRSLDKSLFENMDDIDELIDTHGPTSIEKYIFSKVLFPQHALLDGSITPIQQFCALIRGHLLKMPIHILTYHLTVKFGRWIVESVAGKHFFTPTEENQKTN